MNDYNAGTLAYEHIALTVVSLMRKIEKDMGDMPLSEALDYVEQVIKDGVKKANQMIIEYEDNESVASDSTLPSETHTAELDDSP